MQKLILSFLVGLFSPAGQQTQTATPPAAAAIQPAVFQRNQAAAAELARVLATPPAPADAVARARATVRHETRAEGTERIHRFTFPDGEVVEFSDRPRRPRDQARRERVVMFVGTQQAAKEPDATFSAAGREAGLTPESVEALKFVSRHEGGFDAINTWDRARFSWGFIQFAGGYGFPPALGHLKSKSPALFERLLARYGVDVLPGQNGRPQPVYVNPKDGEVLRGADAEQAFGDDPLVIALFIRAGRVPEVKQRQVEAAIRDYALPALTSEYQYTRLSDVLRSPQGLAMLIDRKVHEGNVGRLEWSLEHATLITNRRNPAEWPGLEGLALDLAIRDADARAKIVELADSAASLLERAATGARNGQMAFVPDGPSLTGARAALEKALYEADYRMVVSYRRDQTRNGIAAVLVECTPDRMRACTAEEAATLLAGSANQVRELVSRFRFEYAIRNRLRNIRESGLAGPPKLRLEYP